MRIVSVLPSTTETLLALGLGDQVMAGAAVLDGSAHFNRPGPRLVDSLADSADAACALLNLPEDASGTSTVESKTNFLGAVRAGTVTAIATPLHVGGTTIVVETSVRDASGRLVAKVTQTQIVLRPRR